MARSISPNPRGSTSSTSRSVGSRWRVGAAIGVFAALLSGAAPTPAAASPGDPGTIGGIVFDDNGGTNQTPADIADGEFDTGESGLSGVEVTVVCDYDHDSDPATAPQVSTDTVTTGVSGTFSLASVEGADCRVVVDPATAPAGHQPTTDGPQAETGVIWLENVDAAVGGLVFGFHDPADYRCGTYALATSCFVRGDQSGVDAADEHVLVGFDETSSGYIGEPGHTTPDFLGDAGEIGTTYGLAYRPGSDTLYAGAYTKRHAGYGPNGEGAIYVVPTVTTSPGTPVLLVDLGAGADATAVPRGTSGWDRDVDAFAAVGKTGLGDLELGPGGDTLWAVHMEDKTLVRLPLDAAGTALTAATDATAITSPCSVATQWRPMAVAHDGTNVFVGGVCDQDLTAHVMRFDAPGFTEVTSFNLGYNRRCAGSSNSTAAAATAYVASTCSADRDADWEPWEDVWANIPQPDDSLAHPQPMFADLEFDGDDLIIGLRDRFGDQIGSFDRSPDLSDPQLYEAFGSGDILRMCDDGASGWDLEVDGSCGGVTTSGAGTGQGPDDPAVGPGTSDGTPSGEFYFGDYALNALHDEVAFGGLALIPGSDRVAVTAMDPRDVQTGGVLFFESSGANAGDAPQRYELYEGTSNGTDGNVFGKANGLGDAVWMCSAPLEIGNYVWFDADGDGQADPSEPALADVIVRLFADTDGDGDPNGPSLGQVTTDAAGRYLFTNISVPAGIAPNTDYVVEFDVATNSVTGPAGEAIELTTANTSGGDQTDSDATDVGGGLSRVAYTTGAAGANDHSIDAGFTTDRYDLALVKTLAAGQSVNVTVGETVTFDVTVINQGDLPAADVEVTEYLPTGLTYDSLVTPATSDDGNAVTFGGTAPDVTISAIAVDDQVTYQVLATVDVGATGILTNWAEISVDDGDDADSTPDTTNGTTTESPVDDEVDNAGGDEDDHDGASVTVTTPAAEYDLALVKLIDGGDPGPVSVGDQIDVTIVVRNQGAAPAAFSVIDTIPEGMNYVASTIAGVAAGGSSTDPIQLDDSDADPVGLSCAPAAGAPPTGGTFCSYTDSGGGTLGWTVPAGGDELDPGEEVELTYTAEVFSVTEVPTGTFRADEASVGQPMLTEFRNVAEIAIDNGADADSSPDLDPGDDDVIDRTERTDVTIDDEAGDSDDHDIAVLTPETLYELGNLVWLDLDADGIADDGEPGIAGVDVQVWRETGADGVGDDFVAQVTTDGDGHWVVTGLTAGDYQVVVPGGQTELATVFSTLPDVSDPDAGGDVDNDDNGLAVAPTIAGSEVRTGIVTLGGTEPTNETLRSDDPTDDHPGNSIADDASNMTVDVGYVDPEFDLALIHTIVGADPSPLEVGDSFQARITVANQGQTPGGATIRDLLPDGLTLTGATAEVGATGAVITTVAPGPDGEPQWSIDNLDPGEQVSILTTIRVDDVTDGTGALVPSFTLTAEITADTGPEADDDSTPDPDLGNDPVIDRLLESDITIDNQVGDSDDHDIVVVSPAPLYQLGNLVWLDLDADGIADDGEPGLSGVTVELLDADGDVVTDTVTNGDGHYVFGGLSAGDYRVRIDGAQTALAGHGSTTPTVADPDDDVDNDDNGEQSRPLTEVLSGTVTLGGTEPTDETLRSDDPTDDDTGVGQPDDRSNLSVDFGFIPLAGLGDLVFLDTDRDGVQDDGETGVAGVVVQLVDQGGNVVTETNTDADGRYEFRDLMPGTYGVVFELSTLPDGYRVTTRDVDVATDATDSDGDPATGATITTVLDPGEFDPTWDLGVHPAEIDLVISKTLNTEESIGAIAVWDITVRNNGPDPDPGPITVRDELPSALSFQASRGEGWICSGTTTIECVLDRTLAVGETTPLLQLTTQISGTGNVTNTASVLSFGLELVVSNNTGSAIVNPSTNNNGAVADGGDEGDTLAFTGVTTWLMVSGALILMIVGALLLSRTRRTVPVGARSQRSDD